MLLKPSHKVLTHRPISANECIEYLCIEYVLPMICMPSELTKKRGPYVYICITCKKEATRRTHGQWTDTINEKWPMNVTQYVLHYLLTNFITVNICWRKKNHIHCILLLHDHFRWNFSPWDIHSRDYQVKVTKLINRSQLWEYWEVSRARPQGPCGGWGVISHSIVSRRMQRQTLLPTDC